MWRRVHCPQSRPLYPGLHHACLRTSTSVPGDQCFFYWQLFLKSLVPLPLHAFEKGIIATKRSTVKESPLAARMYCFCLLPARPKTLYPSMFKLSRTDFRGGTLQYVMGHVGLICLPLHAAYCLCALARHPTTCTACPAPYYLYCVSSTLLLVLRVPHPIT